MILSFEDFIEDRHYYGVLRKDGNPETIEYHIPRNYQIFFSRRGFCPSCQLEAKTVFYKSAHYHDDYYSEQIWECEKCGWWEGSGQFNAEYRPHSNLQRVADIFLYHSLVKRFNESSPNLPLKALLRELNAKQQLLYGIHPKKMEEIAQYALGQFFSCDVSHVGKSGDGGIDLVLILKDEPILVQVKRRTKSEAVESVSTVRDILGAMFIQNSRKGIIVSTANHFSKPSHKIKDELLENGKLEYFDLIDYDKFMSILDLIRKPNMEPWREIVTKGLIKQ